MNKFIVLIVLSSFFGIFAVVASESYDQRHTVKQGLQARGNDLKEAGANFIEGCQNLKSIRDGFGSVSGVDKLRFVETSHEVFAHGDCVLSMKGEARNYYED